MVNRKGSLVQVIVDAFCICKYTAEVTLLRKTRQNILREDQEFATKEKKNKIEPGVVAHVCNHSSTQEAEAGWIAIGMGGATHHTILWR